MHNVEVLVRARTIAAAVGIGTVFLFSDAAAAVHAVSLVLSASNPHRESFVRVINRSVTDGEVRIDAIDDSGWQPPPLALSIAANQTIHFNSSDLEEGNPEKGLTGATGPPMEGDWRLRLESRLDIEVLAYVRTRDGMLTSMLDLVARGETGHRVPYLNPGRNAAQTSWLRLVNPGDAVAEVTIAGVDDRGESPGSEVRLTIPAGEARRYTARQLETGSHPDLNGALGTGTGKWQLIVTSEEPVQPMSLLQSPTGHLTNLSTSPAGTGPGTAEGGETTYAVDLFPSASHPTRQGFVRVINHGDEPGEVRITVSDSSPRSREPVTLSLDAHETAHFNSQDLEDGNAEKGLSGGVGAGEGAWRLELRSDLDFEVLAYIRHRDGFLTSIHDPVPRSASRHRVSTFNPGDNPNQVSQLRLINPGEKTVEVTIEGIDGRGESPGSEVRLSLPASAARTYTARELELGSHGDLTGSLGDGRGKWQLIVSAERPIRLMSLLQSPTGHLTNLSTRPPVQLSPRISSRFEQWFNDLDPKPWWRESAPYSCEPYENPDSPWREAGMADLGGADPLSLIRWFGNGSYLRYGAMGFEGCTWMWKYPDTTNRDPPADPTYYSLGEVEIHVDIARVPRGARGWQSDDGTRADMTMAETVRLLNAHVAPYFRKISEGRFRITFREGSEFEVPGDGSPDSTTQRHREVLGIDCDDYPCSRYDSGALNRMLLWDVTPTAAGAWNGSVRMSLGSVEAANMGQIVHEIGHAWMFWPHSYAEVRWKPYRDSDIDAPNPYSNRFDFMSRLAEKHGWRQSIPATLAINRYAAGWIAPENVALHLTDHETYTLRKPRDGGNQFLVVHSGRPHAFTTLEVPDERDPAFVQPLTVYDPSAPEGRRPFNYDGVLVNRYDQTVGTGANARVGPAFHDTRNPDFLSDVGWGRDDHALIVDGATRDLGGGVSVTVHANADGSHDVTLTGGRYAEFGPWCKPIRFLRSAYDTGCHFDHPR